MLGWNAVNLYELNLLPEGQFIYDTIFLAQLIVMQVITAAMTSPATQPSSMSSQQPPSASATGRLLAGKLVNQLNNVNALCSLLKPNFKRMSGEFSERGPDLKLSEMFFNPDKLYEPGMLDDLIRGVSSSL